MASLRMLIAVVLALSQVQNIAAQTSATAISADTSAPTQCVMNVVCGAFTLTGSAQNDKYEWVLSGATCPTTPGTTLSTATTNHVIDHTFTAPGTYKLCFMDGGDATAAQNNAPFNGVVVVQFGSLGSDPVIMHGNEKTYIWFPLATQFLILQTTEINVYAEAFGTSDSNEQWFNHFLITTRHGLPVADLTIKKDLLHFNRTATPAGTFETLNVKLGGSAQPLAMLPPKGEEGIEAFGDDGEAFGLPMVIGLMSSHWMQDNGRYTAPAVVGEKSHHFSLDQARIGKASRECVELVSPTVNLLICSAPALEYAGSKKAIEYAHLDMFTDFQGKKATNNSDLKGVLPEVWGVSPMTDATKAMLIPPKPKVINV